MIHVDPTSEDCYLFVKVENGIADIEKAGTTTVASQMTRNGWKYVDGNVYVYVGTGAGANAPLEVSASANIHVFDNITIDGSVNGDTLANYKDKTITVTAYAVQKDGFEGKTAEAIWAAAFPNA